MYCRNCRKWFPNNISICDSCGMPLVEDLDIYGENFFYGDAQAFEYIYKESYNWVAGEVSKVLPAGSPEAEGCINTIYNVLYEKIKDYNPEQGSFTAWFAILIQDTIYNYGVVKEDSRDKGNIIKNGLVKVLATVIVVAIIGSGIFVGRRLNKQPQGDKKETTISKEDITQKSTQKQKDVKKTEKENNNNKKKDIKNEEKEKQKDTKVSVMDVIDQNKPFVEEILEMEAGYSFNWEDREDNFENIMLRSLNRLYGNEVEEGQTTNIWDVVPKENVKQCEYQEGGGKISVKESGFERMREFLGCTETITNLCANDYDTFSCVDGIVREDSAQPVGEETLRIDQIAYKTLSNGDVQAFYICNKGGEGVEEIDTAIITQADNTLGIQLNSCDIIALREIYDIHKIFGSIAALGKECKNDGALVNIEQISEKEKEAALIFSVYWQCVSKNDDVNAWEFGYYYPIFSKDDVIDVDDFTVTLPHDAFDDYLEFVDYNGTIDDMIDNNDFKYEYGCSISRSGDKLTFTYDEDYDVVCTLQPTEETGYNWDGFELEENGDLKVTCLLYDESEKSSGIGYTATIKFTDNAFGMQLESLEKES